MSEGKQLPKLVECPVVLEQAIKDAIAGASDPWEMQKAISRAVTRAGMVARNPQAPGVLRAG